MGIRSSAWMIAIGCAAAAAMTVAIAQTAPPRIASRPLKSTAEFQSIVDRAERSRAIFAEIGTVLTHPRCMNCHPAGEHPLQGADHHDHRPAVWRNDTGNFGTPCSECHTQQNVTLREAASYRSIPGHPRWGVPPLSMAWQAKSLGDICGQLKDTARNGGRDLAMLQEHVAKDDLVAWGWNPGEGREPAPGTQEAAGELVQAWIDSGAECPQ
ncbi:MAG TPA: Isoquinoline 1-oxidoreductase subunit [Bradyrhizobium sp.]|nr:Isoquinoline 1-oxidoreductase subunit [Bradyrhizobium sp.]